MIPQSIIEAIAAHNKKGNADAIELTHFAIVRQDTDIPLNSILECKEFPDPVEALSNFVQWAVGTITDAHPSPFEVLGYSVLVMDDSVLRVSGFVGRPLTPEQKEIRKALAELSEADQLEYNNMLTALRKVLSPAAFDTYRKALSLAGVTRNQWNQEQNKGRIPRYTGPADGNVVFYPGTRFSESEKKL